MPSSTEQKETFGPFTVLKSVGSGSFGKVQLVRDANGVTLCIKIAEEKHSLAKAMLKHEVAMYEYVKNASHKSKPCLPEVYWVGRIETQLVMAMERLGPSLSYYLNTGTSHGRFSHKTTLMLAIQMLDLVSVLHCCGVVHRDLKPDNLVFGAPGSGNENKLFLIDLGLAKVFKTPDNKHIKFQTGKPLTGTARYTSLYSHMGYELSRRDDLESLLYLWIFFMKGSLPWQGLPKNVKKREKYRRIGEKKRVTSPEMLCKDVPTPFLTFFKRIRTLTFKQRPDYVALRNLFTSYFTKKGFVYDRFDWQEGG